MGDSVSQLPEAAFPACPLWLREAVALIKVGKGFVEFDQTGTFVSHT